MTKQPLYPPIMGGENSLRRHFLKFRRVEDIRTECTTKKFFYCQIRFFKSQVYLISPPPQDSTVLSPSTLQCPIRNVGAQWLRLGGRCDDRGESFTRENFHNDGTYLSSATSTDSEASPSFRGEFPSESTGHGPWEVLSEASPSPAGEFSSGSRKQDHGRSFNEQLFTLGIRFFS